jgi:predicted small lipoprotein YifL
MRFLSGGAVFCLIVATVALSACGQRGALVLPSEVSKNNDKASYILYSPKKEAASSTVAGSSVADKAESPVSDSVAPAADSK